MRSPPRELVSDFPSASIPPWYAEGEASINISRSGATVRSAELLSQIRRLMHDKVVYAPLFDPTFICASRARGSA